MISFIGNNSAAYLMMCSYKKDSQQRIIDRVAKELGVIAYRPNYFGKDRDKNTVLFYTKEDHLHNVRLENSGDLISRYHANCMNMSDKEIDELKDRIERPYFFWFENSDINGMFYGISLHSMNPFCGEVFYLKIPVLQDNKIYDACYELLCNEWPNFTLATEYQTSLQDINFIASFLFNKMMKANKTMNIPTKAVQVENLYDGGYHIEKLRPTMTLFDR